MMISMDDTRTFSGHECASYSRSEALVRSHGNSFSSSTILGGSQGRSIGSHGQKHLRLLSLNKKKRRDELMYSKAEIERELGMPCDHFCAPYGVPSVDFDLDREGGLSEELGYQSFATGARGANREGDSPFALKRDHLLAGWGDYQLQYFFSR